VFKTIVVGHDGSPQAELALALALALRAPDGARLVLAAASRSGTPHTRAVAVLERLAQTLPAGVGAEVAVLDAHPAPYALALLASARDADLLVLGPTHRGELHRTTGRTTVQRLLHAAPCTLAVAGVREDGLPPQPRIVIAHDGSVEADGALKTAYEVAVGTGGSVRLVRVLAPMAELTDDAAAGALAAAAARAPAGVATETHVLRGAPPDRLLEDALDADLLVIGSRHHGAVRRAVTSSVSASVLARSDLPVLVWGFPHRHPVDVPMPPAGAGARVGP
jgi:nucleotide-binding universal stress UspA family protein